MLQLKNNTPFNAAIAVIPDENGIDCLYVMVKATFQIGSKVEVASEQMPLEMTDTYWGEPADSSLRYASEYHLLKPSTDVVMVGEACAPEKKSVQALAVALAVGGKTKTVRVFGERRWTTGIIGLDISTPAPFESMPMVYERAFGGVHVIDAEAQKVLYEPRNPVGAGFQGKRKNGQIKGTLLPNLEDPSRLIRTPRDNPPPACFGFVAPSWEPRKRHVGTYDDQWIKKRAPYLPADFDSRFFNAATPDLICETYLKGGEPVMIANMSPHGPFGFNLPQAVMEAKVRIAGKNERPALNLETVLLEPTAARMCMLWRAGVPCDKKALKVEQIDLTLDRLSLS